MVHELGSFSEVIRKLRKKAGINQHELAKALGVNQQTVSRWEKGALPRKEMFIKIARFFNVDHNELSVISTAEQYQIAKENAELAKREGYNSIDESLISSQVDESNLVYKRDIDELSREFERIVGASFILKPKNAWDNFYKALLKLLQNLTLDIVRRKAISDYMALADKEKGAINEIKNEFIENISKEVFQLLITTSCYDIVNNYDMILAEETGDCIDDDK